MQSLGWYFNRAKAMSAEELAARARRQVRSGAERLGIVGNDVAAEPLRPLELGLAAFPVPAAQPAAAQIIAAADETRAGVFRFFGRAFDLGVPPAWNTDPLTGTTAPLTFGKSIDYRDSRVVGDAKHVWELNRHLELVGLAQAYRLTGDAGYLEALRVLLMSWIEQNPYMRGVNWCSSLELAIRLINWHLAYCIAGGGDSPLFAGSEGRRLRDAWLRSIYQHNYFVMHHLSTYPSSANNHLIGEAAGVYVSCCTWPYWPATDKWLQQTKGLLHREIQSQTHSDGINKEQTTWYQQFVACLCLVAGLAGRRAGDSFPSVYWETLAKMIHFLSAVMDAGGNVPMIGDADDGLAFALEPRATLDPFRSLLAVGAELFDDPLWRSQSRGSEATAQWLCAGFEPLPREAAEAANGADEGQRPRNRREFSEGGYYVLGRDLGMPQEVRVLFDAGPLGYLSIAGHGHADCLALMLSVAGREQLVDTGTFAYHSGKEWRDYFRGTAAHNTVRVDGVDQSEIGGPFLWLRKAAASVDSFACSLEQDQVAASHDGYLRLPDPVRHARQATYDKAGDMLEIVDRLTCRREHRIERFWHFAEHCKVELDGATAISSDGHVRLEIQIDESGGECELRSGATAPISGWISRSFGCKVPTSTLVYTNTISGSAELRTRIRVRTL